MSLVKVKEYFREYGIEDEIIELDGISATVIQASQALGVESNQIAKTLAFMLDEPILIVMSGDAKIDNHKYKEYFGKKAKMIPQDDLDSLIGHKIGGVCPFAIKDGVKVYLDESLKANHYVYPACGSVNSAIKLSIEQLEKYSSYVEWVDVTK